MSCPTRARTGRELRQRGRRPPLQHSYYRTFAPVVTVETLHRVARPSVDPRTHCGMSGRSSQDAHPELAEAGVAQRLQVQRASNCGVVREFLRQGPTHHRHVDVPECLFVAEIDAQSERVDAHDDPLRCYAFLHLGAHVGRVRMEAPSLVGHVSEGTRNPWRHSAHRHERMRGSRQMSAFRCARTARGRS